MTFVERSEYCVHINTVYLSNTVNDTKEKERKEENTCLTVRSALADKKVPYLTDWMATVVHPAGRVRTWVGALPACTGDVAARTTRRSAETAENMERKEENSVEKRTDEECDCDQRTKQRIRFVSLNSLTKLQ